PHASRLFPTRRSSDLPDTCTTEPIHVYEIRDGRLAVELDFPPSEAHIVVIRDEPELPHVAESNLDVAAFDGETVVGFHEGGEEAFARVGRDRWTAEAREPPGAITLP